MDLEEVAKKLGLTNDDQKKLDSLFVQNRRKLIDLRGNMEKERLELELILDEEDFNKTACLNQFKKVQDARTNLALERFGFLIEVRKLLGYERFQELKNSVRKRQMHRRKDRQGKRRHKESERFG